MSKISAYPAATALATTELVPVIQGGINKKATVQQILDQALAQVRNSVAGAYDTLAEEHAFSAAIGSALTAHVSGTDPIAHEADKVGYSGTVSAADVAGALDALDANKVGVGTIPELTRMIAGSPFTVNKNTTVAEETLLTFSLGANVLDGDGDFLVIEASGDILANNGTPSFAWKLKNGLVVIDTPADPLAVSANQRRWKLRAAIRRQADTVQDLSMQLDISQPGTTFAMPIDKSYVGNIAAISNTDFSVASAVTFTVQMSGTGASSANNRVRMYGFSAYKVPI